MDDVIGDFTIRGNCFPQHRLETSFTYIEINASSSLPWKRARNFFFDQPYCAIVMQLHDVCFFKLETIAKRVKRKVVVSL